MFDDTFQPIQKRLFNCIVNSPFQNTRRYIQLKLMNIQSWKVLSERVIRKSESRAPESSSDISWAKSFTEELRTFKLDHWYSELLLIQFYALNFCIKSIKNSNLYEETSSIRNENELNVAVAEQVIFVTKQIFVQITIIFLIQFYYPLFEAIFHVSMEEITNSRDASH